MRLLLLLAFVVSAQDRPREGCSLSGTVVSSVTGEGLGKVELVLEPVAGPRGSQAVTTTDSEGRFAMVELDPGSYRLIGTRNGYLETAYGAKRAERSGSVVRLEAGVSLAGLTLKLIPFGVIAGTVRDADGEPLNGAQVQAARLTYEHGRPRIEDYDSRETDDLGQYRIPNLPPGKYYVGAKPGNDRRTRIDHSSGKPETESTVATVYPGSADESLAAPVEVAAGARVTGIDIKLARVRAYTVKGQVVTGAGSGAPGASITLRPQDRGMDLEAALATIARGASGDFEIRGVQAGRYQLTAVRGGAEVAAMPLEITGSTEEVRVVLGKGAQVTARMGMEGGETLKPGRFQIFLSANARNGYFLEPESGSIARHGNVAPDRYEVQVENLPPGTYLKSIHAGEADVLNGGLRVTQGSTVQLEIVLASDAGKVEGRVADKDDIPAEGATVVLVPEPKFRGRGDLYKTAATDQTGKYEISNVPPGEYKVFAWDDVEPGIWNDPEFLKEHEKKGTAVTVGSKGHETVNVKL